MSKVGLHVIAFREERLIERFLKHLTVDKYVVAVSERPYKGEMERDRTYEIAKRTLKGKDAVVKLGYWESEHEQRNWINSQLKDVDVILYLNPDSFLLKKDQKFSKVDRVWGCNNVNYWKRPNRITQPTIVNKVFLSPPGVEFWDKSIIDPNPPVMEGTEIHHLGWIRPNWEIREKIATYAHADEIIGDWYDTVWLSDKTDNVGPTNPPDFKKVVSYEMPDEILQYV